MNVRTFPLYLAVPVIAGVFLWYFNRSTPDVRYSLSEPILVSFAHPGGKLPDGKPAEVVQQLEVKNVGNLQADNVLVKIRGSVKEYILKKHSETDDTKETNRERLFEVHYPALPPGGSFQLSFKSNGDGVAARDVSVSDSRGLARDALASAGPGTGTYVLWSLIAFYLLLILSTLRSSSVGGWKIGKWREPVGQIVSSTKPFYMSEKEWKGAVTDAVKEAIRGPHLIHLDISKHPAYRLLQLDAPSALADDAEWKVCTELAVDTLVKEYSGAVNGAFPESRVLEILDTQRPRDFPESKWMELKTHASKRYVEIRKRGHLTKEGALKCLQEAKPSSVTPDAWQSLVEYWQNEYYTARMNWVTGPTAMEYLQESRPDAVPLQLWDKLTKSWESTYFAHVMDGLRIAGDASSYTQGVLVNLLNSDHREVFEHRVRDATNRERAERCAKLMEGLLGGLLEGNAIPTEKPTELPDHEWIAIRRIQKELQCLRGIEEVGRANEQKALELKARESELKAKHEKVDRQLQFIHKILTDPSSIDRVEDYDDTFSKGNFDNLKRLASASQPPDGVTRKRRKPGEDSG